MQIQFLNLKFNSVPNYNLHNEKYFNLKNNSNTDIFIKSSKISFQGANKPVKKDNLADALVAGGIIGAAFLSGLAVSAGMSKLGAQAKDIVLDPNGYKISEDGITSNSVTINHDEGIIKIDGTGININADDYDYVDWEKGIFKNYDGSVDIDLLNNKFIDTENGIFVDPDAQIAAVLDGDHFENIAIPNFGSGYPTQPHDPAWSSMPAPDPPAIIRSDFIEKYNLAPEQYQEKFGNIPYNKILPDDNRTVFQKLSDIFKGEEHNKMYDIFGNEIISVTDANGDSYLTSMAIDQNSPLYEMIHNIKDNSIAAEVYNNAKLSAYMENKFPQFGTRVMVYEGGRNPHIPDFGDPKLNMENIKNILEKISQDGDYTPEAGSAEAIEFIKYQNDMLSKGLIEKPIVALDNLLDANGDHISDTDIDGDGIPDSDIDGDGIVDLSSHGNSGVLDTIFDTAVEFFKNIFGGK